MSAQTGDQQQVSKGLLITLGVVAAIGVAAALWVFVVQPLTTDESETVAVDDQVEAAEPDDDAEADPAPDAEADEPDDPSGDGEGDDPEDGDDTEDGGDAEAAEDDPLESTQVVNARDPFTQLVTDTGGGSGSGGAATATGGGSTGGSTASGDGDDGGDDTADVDSTTVTLVDIYTGDDDLQRASIEVNETGYDVLEGETFADNFQLLDIAEECATLLYGDSRFTLCEGDRVRK